MPRPLTPDMEDINNGGSAKRSPAFIVEVWDIRAGLNTVSDVVTGALINATTGPFDISEFVEVVNFQEQSGDYITSGVRPTLISGTVQDPNGEFDPDGVIADPTALGRLFRRGNLIRITLGDERVDESEWVEIFTGRFAGQVGYNRNRAPNTISQLTFKAYGREATFLQFTRTSDEFTNVDPQITYLEMAESVAENEMGLATAEINFIGFGDNVLKHASVQLAEENPLSMLAKIMFVNGLLPKFDGSGILTTTDGRVTASNDRTYSDSTGIISISRPLTEVQPPDAVCIVGLDAELSRVDQPRQVIAEVNVTTGYFTSDERIEVFWSDDRTYMADNVVFEVLKSVNGGLSSLGGGENITPIASPAVLPGGTSIGDVGVTITIDTGFAPWVGVFLLATYVALSAVPDSVLTFGLGASTGFTINIGSIAAAAALAGAMIIMTRLGRGQYRFVGDPFEFVYQEIRQCAADSDVGVFERIEVEVKNHLIDNITDAQRVAKEQLFRQAARGRPRDVLMVHDVGLEPDDTFEVSSSGRRFLVDTISYKLQRGSDANIMANVKCFEVTDDISEAT